MNPDAIKEWAMLLSKNNSITTNETNLEKSTIHEHKILPQYFQPIMEGLKTFEIRKITPKHSYRVGDILHLREHTGTIYTGRETWVRITYVLSHTEYVKDGYVVLSIKEFNYHE